MHKELSLNAFTAIDDTGQTATYIAALEAFDRIVQLQELKRLERDGAPGQRDTGCWLRLRTRDGLTCPPHREQRNGVRDR